MARHFLVEIVAIAASSAIFLSVPLLLFVVAVSFVQVGLAISPISSSRYLLLTVPKVGVFVVENIAVPEHKDVVFEDIVEAAFAVPGTWAVVFEDIAEAARWTGDSIAEAHSVVGKQDDVVIRACVFPVVPV
jgi:hypothetical protein